MALQVDSLTLDEATLSGGARIAAAGSGLPRRVTTQAPVTYRVGHQYAGVIWDPDGAHVWVTNFSPSRIRKVNIATGTATDFSIAAGGFMGISRIPGNTTHFFVCEYVSAGPPGKLHKVAFATGAIAATYTMIAGRRATSVAPSSDPDLVWFADLTSLSTVREYRLSTQTETGRSAPIGVNNIFGVVASSDGAYYYLTTASLVAKVNALTNALVTSWSLNSSFQAGAAGTGDAAYMQTRWSAPLSDGTVLTMTDRGTVDSPNYSGTTYAGVSGWKRIMTLWPEAGSPGIPFGIGSELRGPWLAEDDQGDYLAFLTRGAPTSDNVSDGLRIMRRSTQRARWSQTFASPVTLKGIAVPGLYGGGMDGSADLRRGLVYYAVNGGARVAYSPGTPLDIDSVTSVVVDADLSPNWLMPVGPAPYVGGDAGEGITLLYDDPAATLYAPQVVTRYRGRVNPVAVRGRMEIR